jgi:hypothetical protein
MGPGKEKQVMHEQQGLCSNATEKDSVAAEP